MDGLTRKAFLDALYTAYFQEFGGYLAIRSTTNWYANIEPFFCFDLDLLGRQRFETDRDVYFSVCPVEHMTAQTDQVRHITALWANLDIGKEGHRGTRHYPGRAEAANAIAQFPLAPSAVVDSGRGYHLYWLLGAVEEISNPRVVTSLLVGISRFFQGEPQTNTEAILRLPQTFNNKLKGTPVPCLIMNMDPSLRYRIKDFDGLETLALSRGLVTGTHRVPSDASVDQTPDSDREEADGTTARLGQLAPNSDKTDTRLEPTLEIVAGPVIELEDKLVPLPQEGPEEIEITDEFYPAAGDLSESGSIGKQAITLENSLEALASELQTDPEKESTPKKRPESIDPDDIEVQKILEVEQPSVVLTKEDLFIEEDSGSGETQITAELDGTALEDDQFIDTDAITTQGIDFEAVESILADTASASAPETRLGGEKPWKPSDGPQDDPIVDFSGNEIQEDLSSVAAQEDTQFQEVTQFAQPVDGTIDLTREDGSEPGAFHTHPADLDERVSEEIIGELHASPGPAGAADTQTDGTDSPPTRSTPFIMEEGFGALDDEEPSGWDETTTEQDLTLGSFSCEYASKEPLPTTEDLPKPQAPLALQDDSASQAGVFWTSVMQGASPEEPVPVPDERPDSHEAPSETAVLAQRPEQPPKMPHPRQTLADQWRAVPWPEQTEAGQEPADISSVPVDSMLTKLVSGTAAWRDDLPASEEDFGGTISSGIPVQPQAVAFRLDDRDRIGPKDPLTAAFQPEQTISEPRAQTLPVKEPVPTTILAAPAVSDAELMPQPAPMTPEVPAVAPEKWKDRFFRRLGEFLNRIGNVFGRTSGVPAQPGKESRAEPLQRAVPTARRTRRVWDRDTQAQAPISLLCGASVARLFRTGESLPGTKTALIKPGRSFSGEPMEVYEGTRRLVLIPLPEALQNRGAGAQIKLTVRHSGKLVEVEVADPDSDWEREYRLSLPEWDEVDCTVHGPSAAGPGETFTVQVHFDPAGLSGSSSGEARALSSSVLELSLCRGTILSAQLVMEGPEITQPPKEKTWEGESTSFEFTVRLPRILKSGQVAGRVIVRQDNVPIGQVEFSLEVDAEHESTDLESRPMGEGVRFERFYIVSAWEDRAQVLEKVRELTLLGKSFADELLRLTPEAKAESGWKAHVHTCDAVLLFWSPNAGDSPQCIGEYRYAREKKGAARIVPMLLGGASLSELPRDLLGPASSRLVSDSVGEPVPEGWELGPHRIGKAQPTHAGAVRESHSKGARLPVSFRFGSMVRTLIREGTPVPGAVSVRLKIPRSGPESKSLEILEGTHLLESFALEELREMIPQGDRVTLSLQHLGKVLFVQFRADGSPQRRNFHLPLAHWDWVGIGVSCPARVQAGENFLLEVSAAAAGEDGEGNANTSSGNTAPEESGDLGIGVIRGSVLGFHLVMRGFDVRENVREITWQGHPESVSYSVGVPRSAGGGVTGILKVSLDGIPVGQVSFKVQVAAPGEGLGSTGRVAVQARLFRSFFISFAAEDRVEVAKRLKVLQLAGTHIREDLLALSPADRWNRKLYQGIDETDAVLLFWSRHARKSQVVLRECIHARNRKGIDGIIAVLLERPVPALPSELADLSLDDRILSLIE